MVQQDRTRNRLLAVVTAILVIAALKLSRPVTLPLVAGVFLATLAWPLQALLERRLPRWLAFTGTVLAVLIVSAVIAGAFVWTVDQLVSLAPQLLDRGQQLSRSAADWGRAHGLPLPRPTGGREQLAEPLTGLVGITAKKAYSTLALIGLVAVFLFLGLLEVREFEAKLHRIASGTRTRMLVEASSKIATQVRRYLLALTISSALSGVATGLFALAIGLQPALMWGLVTYILNYIPRLGPLIAVVPPTFFALIQAESLTRPLIVFAGIGTIQFVMGNFVDPKIEGHVLSLSPFGVLVAIVLWGWMWGILGAFLAVPLTVTFVIVCRQFAATRWLADLFAGREEVEEGGR